MNTIQQVARQAAHETHQREFWREDAEVTTIDLVADAVAVAVLQQLQHKGSSYAIEALAAFTPAEPPQQETDDARICPQDGSVCWTPGCEVAYCQEEADRQAAESAAPAEPQTLEPDRLTPQALDALLQEADGWQRQESLEDCRHSGSDVLICGICDRKRYARLTAALRSLQADASAKEEKLALLVPPVVETAQETADTRSDQSATPESDPRIGDRGVS